MGTLHLSGIRAVRPGVILPKVILMLSVLFLTLESYSTVSIDVTNFNKEVSLTDSINRLYTVVRHFMQERKAYFIVLGLFRITGPIWKMF